MAKLTNHVQRTRLITSSTDKHYSLDSEDDFRSGCRNVSHQRQFFSELLSPGRLHHTKKRNKTAPVHSFKVQNIHQTPSLSERWFKCRVLSYNNPVATFNLSEITITHSGDVHTIAWPRFRIDNGDHYTYH